MKRRVRNFTPGGDVSLEDFENKALPKAKPRDLEDFEDKAMPKRYSALDALASGEEKGSFDQDVYERAKRFVNKEAAAPKAASKPAPKPATKAAAPASAARVDSTPTGQIPGAGSYTAPPSDGSRSMSDTERNILNTLGGVSGLSGLRMAARGAQAAKPTSRAVATSETPVTFLGASGRRSVSPAERVGANKMDRLEGPKSGVPVKGGDSPKQLPPAKAEANVTRRRIGSETPSPAIAKGRAEAMEANKPIMQATPKKKSPRSRTRDEDTDYELRARGGRVGYANGGQVRGGGCEMRGLRKCRVI
jgi:hypothetical protein